MWSGFPYPLFPMPEISDPHETLGVRRDASLAEIRIAYRRSTQILAPERFANASETVRAEAERRLSTLHAAMQAIEEAQGGDGSSLGALGSTLQSRIKVLPVDATPVVPEAPDPVAKPARARKAAAPTTPPAAAETEADAEAVVETPIEAPAEPVEAEAAAEAEPKAKPEPEVEAEPEDNPEAKPEAQAAAQAATEAELEPEVEAEPEADIEAEAPALADEPMAPPVAPPVEDFTRERYLPTPTKAKRYSAMQRRLAAGALVLSLLAIAGIWMLNGKSSSSSTTQTFTNAGFSFDHPASFVPRTPPTGAKQPTASAAFGPDNQNYIVVATYRASFDVQPDGSAISATGAKLTADRLATSIEVAVRDIARASGLTAGGQKQDAKLGSINARAFTYAATDNSRNTTYVIGFSGKTELYVACASTPKFADVISKACDQARSTVTLH